MQDTISLVIEQDKDKSVNFVAVIRSCTVRFSNLVI